MLVRAGRGRGGETVILLLGSLTIGLILTFLALGVFISFRVFGIADITADGSITLGASVAAVMLAAGYDPLSATVCGFLAGMVAGAVTGILQTAFRIHSLLAGILVMTALYSVNLHVMGKSNVPLLDETTLGTWATDLFARAGVAGEIYLCGWEVAARDLAFLGGIAAFLLVAGFLLYYFFRTNLGTAMRATGDNLQMIRSLGVNTGLMITTGLALSNGLIALSGALLAQYQGFADVQMGIGMVVWGLASVIIGESLLGTNSLGFSLIGAAVGSVLFRLLVAIALRWGMDPNDLKLVTAVFVLLALVLPEFLGSRKKARHA